MGHLEIEFQISSFNLFSSASDGSCCEIGRSDLAPIFSCNYLVDSNYHQRDFDDDDELSQSRNFYCLSECMQLR
jgi:hypothetical protein